MKLNKLLTAAALGSALTSGLAHAGTLDLAEIVDGGYRPASVPAFRSTADGKHYTALTADGRSLVKYRYSDGAAVDTLLCLDHVKPEEGLDVSQLKLEGYELSADEQRLVVYAGREAIYRRSFRADYFYYVIGRQNFKRLAEGKVQAVTLAPDGRQAVYMRDGNLYLVKVMDASIHLAERAITDDGAKGRIINGVPDWVYEEEFAMDRAITWSADSRVVAYVKWDESRVREYSLPLYRGEAPALADYEFYPGAYTYKYPVAGEANSDVSVWAYNVDTRKNTRMDVPVDADGYIPRIKFTNCTPDEPRRLAVVTLNRHQSILHLFFTNADSGVSRLVVEDKNDQYVSEANLDCIDFYADGFTMVSERSGFRHLYFYGLNGQLKRQLTRGDFDVTDVYGYDPRTRSAYVQTAYVGRGSAMPQELTRGIYRVDERGQMTPLFGGGRDGAGCRGTHSAHFSRGFVYMQHTYSDAETPTRVTLEQVAGLKVLKVMEDNAALRQRTAGMSPREFFQFTTPRGDVLNGYLTRPRDFDPSRRYPVLMEQYSGPGSQQVLDSWKFGWEQYLNQQGYVVACVDGRGTGGRGAAWERQTYCEIGVREAEDQLSAGRYVASLPYVDPARMAIWGWSYGGYCTLMTLTGGNDVYKLGMAVAPVSDFKFYDSVYTERYMRTPQENPRGYERSSALGRADRLKGDLLLVHGSADDNVHPQNTYELAEQLVQADLPFDMMLYTNRNHGIRGGRSYAHVYKQLYRYMQRNL